MRRESSFAMFSDYKTTLPAIFQGGRGYQNVLVSGYQNVSILCFVGAKDDGGDCDNICRIQEVRINKVA